MRADPPLLVELFGQPGAGKTTLARAAAAGSVLRSRAGLGAAWQRLPIHLKASFFARAILDGACLAQAIQLAATERLFLGDSLSRLSRLLIKSHWIRTQSDEMMLEEGCLQDLWSIYYSSGRMEPNPKQLAPLIRRLYRGVRAQLIFLDVDPEIAFDRIRGRAHGKSRLDRLAELELRQHLLASARLSHRLADAARLAGVRVDILDASLPVETTARQLSAVMVEFELSLASEASG